MERILCLVSATVFMGLIVLAAEAVNQMETQFGAFAPQAWPAAALGVVGMVGMFACFLRAGR